MDEIFLFDRLSKKKISEKIFGKSAILYLYKKNSFLSKVLRFLLTHFTVFSYLYGVLQKTRRSKNKIPSFAKEFHIDLSECEKSSYTSFNDFFIRKPKKEARPLALGENIATLPADARYLVFPDIKKAEGFYVKGKKFSLKEFLASSSLAKQFSEGSLVIGRLAPTDCHRFYFPFDSKPQEPTLINGYLSSVNPIAIKRNIRIFSENKRMITPLESPLFGKVLYAEVGAMNVGSIHQTFQPNHLYAKGDEKGYFSFGGSTVMLFFEKDKILFDQDLLENSKERIETKALMGQSLGKALYR